MFWTVSFTEITIIALGGPPTGVFISKFFSTDYIFLLFIVFPSIPVVFQYLVVSA